MQGESVVVMVGLVIISWVGGKGFQHLTNYLMDPVESQVQVKDESLDLIWDDDFDMFADDEEE